MACMCCVLCVLRACILCGILCGIVCMLSCIMYCERIGRSAKEEVLFSKSETFLGQSRPEHFFSFMSAMSYAQWTHSSFH